MVCFCPFKRGCGVKRLLSEDSILLDLKGTTKEAIIGEMIDFLAAAGKLKDRDAAFAAVWEREQKMSTGMQHGIAIPHGKTETVDKLVTALAIKKDGVDFDSMDGKPSHIFVMTVAPVNRTGPHIQFLSEVSQALNDPERRERILAASTPTDVLDALSA